jgi:HSP20 family molecular chaperone IbpA
VTLQDGVLTISGTRTQEEEDKNKRFHRIERAYGAFARSFTLPPDAAEDNVNAEFKNGMLTIRVTKTQKGTPSAPHRRPEQTASSDKVDTRGGSHWQYSYRWQRPDRPVDHWEVSPETCGSAWRRNRKHCLPSTCSTKSAAPCLTR